LKLENYNQAIKDRIVKDGELVFGLPAYILISQELWVINLNSSCNSNNQLFG
jgi:hypothetical protein